MQTGSGAKNPPWARSNVNSNISGINPQIMDPNAMMSQQSMMPFQQTAAVFNPGMMQTQSGMAMSMGGQMPLNQMAQGQMYPGNVVAYPTPRAMNPNIYQNTTNQAPQGNEQRVFTGTVTKTHNDFGFVDHDVFYQTSVCSKGVIPKVNDRVLVEATYNPNMPFKWNATRVQVLPKSNPNQKGGNSKPNNYSVVPPPTKKPSLMPRRNDDRRDDRSSRRDERKRSRSRSRSRSRDRRDSRNRRETPPRKRPIVHQPSPVKYMVRVPKIPLDILKMDVPSLSQRYTNLYIPSDFFNAHVKWGETFPPQSPLSLNSSCQYHIMDKMVTNPYPNDAVLEPPDADYRFSAKVMLISMPTLETLYQKCGLTKVDDKEKRSSKSPLHPTRLIKFLVGQKGKGSENFAIGGPWSPSLDGEKPESDPGVLVKTAIRTCKALTGIDLSNCTQWYRMVEFYYWRESGGKSRLECVVLFLPDVWAVQASGGEWASLGERYKAAADNAIRALDKTDASQPLHSTATETNLEKSQIENKDPNDSTITIDENDDDEDKPEPSHYSKIDLRTIKVDALRHELRARGVSCKGLRAQLISRLSKLMKAEEEKDTKGEEIMEVEDDDDENEKSIGKDVKETKSDKDSDVTEVETNVEEKKEEKMYKQDKKEDEKKDDKDLKDDKDKKDDKVKKEKPKTEKEIEEEKKKLEKEKQLIKSRYEFPSTPHIIVHPSASAKGGKFGCSVVTLSLLLDYRITDNKEHSFELFVFAELFNEMLMRDFGFYIYKTLYTLPEKAEEIKEDKKDDKKEEKKDEKEEDKKEDEDKNKKEDKDKEDKDKKDDKREVRRRERRDSHSDHERSKSPRRRSRGVDLPSDPYLLLSLVYFDTARGGIVSRKDLQSLFISLGLQLSRSQIRAVLEKVCVRDNFSYKPLIQTIKDLATGASEGIQDLPLDSTVVATDVPPHISELESIIAAGNRNLLPVFAQNGSQSAFSETKDISESGLISYKSRIVDVGALVNSAAKWQAERARLQTALEQAQTALKAARAAAASTQQAERGAKSQLSDLSADLAAARARITSLMASSKIFHAALKSIKTKVDAVVNIKYEDDDVVEVVNGLAKEGKESELKLQKEAAKNVESREELKEEKVSKPKDKDIISTENMEIDDKE